MNGQWSLRSFGLNPWSVIGTGYTTCSAEFGTTIYIALSAWSAFKQIEPDATATGLTGASQDDEESEVSMWILAGKTV